MLNNIFMSISIEISTRKLIAPTILYNIQIVFNIGLVRIQSVRGTKLNPQFAAV